MRLSKRQINSKSPDVDKIESLCNSSFSDSDVVSFRKLRRKAKKDNVAFEAYYIEGNFCAISCIEFFEKFVYIHCISVYGRYRSKGIGSLILSDIRRRAGDVPVFAEIERSNENGTENLKELKTLEFFAKNGFCDTGFSVGRRKNDFSLISDSYGFTAEEIFEICNGYSSGFYSPEIKVNR